MFKQSNLAGVNAAINSWSNVVKENLCLIHLIMNKPKKMDNV